MGLVSYIEYNGRISNKSVVAYFKVLLYQHFFGETEEIRGQPQT